MNEANIDFSDVRDAKQLHNLLKACLKLPDYYGENLDALWDLLSGWIKTPVTIDIRGEDILRNRLGSYGDQVLKLFKDAAAEIEGINVVIH